MDAFFGVIIVFTGGDIGVFLRFVSHDLSSLKRRSKRIFKHLLEPRAGLKIHFCAQTQMVMEVKDPFT